MRNRSESPWDAPSLRDSVQPVVRSQSATNLPNTIIGPQCVIKGDLELQGRAQVNCQVEGEISSEGELIIGEEADIKANIFGKIILVFGRVEGHIKCTERLEMHAGAHVTGDVLCPRVVIQDGVVFEGRCWMGEKDPSPQ